MKVAIEFGLIVLNEMHKNLSKVEDRWEVELDDYDIVSENEWLQDATDFWCDFLEPFLESEEFKKLLPDHDYHVFQYGDISGEYSTSEYGTEFDGWVFIEEYTSVKELPKNDSQK